MKPEEIIKVSNGAQAEFSRKLHMAFAFFVYRNMIE